MEDKKIEPEAAFARPYKTIGNAAQIGLTKREYFAAMALTGLLAHPHSFGRSAKNIALDAVELADAMIDALNGEAERDNNMDA